MTNDETGATRPATLQELVDRKASTDHLLAMMRACGWVLKSHYDVANGEPGELFSYWVFEHPAGPQVRGHGKVSYWSDESLLPAAAAAAKFGFLPEG